MWGYGPMMGYGDGRGMGWAMVADSLFWLVLLVLAAILITRILQGANLHTGRSSAGLDILEERYARGEIDRDEYLQKKKDLTTRRPTAQA